MAYQLPTYQDMVDFTADTAVDAGLDPTEVVRGFRGEGLGPNIWQSQVVKGGVQEPSYGIPQLHSKYLGADFERDTGLQVEDPANWREVAKYGIGRLKDTGWSPYYGAQKVGLTGAVTPFDPKRPFNPSLVAGYDTDSGAQKTMPQPSLLAPPDPTDQPQGGLIDPYTGLPAQPAAAGPAYPSGIMNFLRSPEATGLASGLLLAGGSSPRKVGFGEAFGTGLQEMGKAQALASANEVKREQLASQAISDQQTRLMNLVQMQRLEQEAKQKATDSARETAQLRSQTIGALTSAEDGYNAAMELKNIPGGGLLAVQSTDKINWLRNGVELAKAGKTQEASSFLQRAFGVGNEMLMGQLGYDLSTPEGIAAAEHQLNLVETLNKQRKNTARQLQGLSSKGNNSAYQLQQTMEGYGEGAGLDVNIKQFGDAKDRIRDEATTYGFLDADGNILDEKGNKIGNVNAPATPDLNNVPPPTSSTPPPTASNPPSPNDAKIVAKGGAPVQAGAGGGRPVKTVPIFKDQTAAQAWAKTQPPGVYHVQAGNVMITLTVTP